MKYRAFLSYSHADRKWARWLHRRLEAYKPPRALKAADGTALEGRLRPIFRDRDELPSTASLTDAVRAGLAGSEWLIVICSPNSAGSRWVNEEIRTFRAQGKGDHILALIVDGEPGAENGLNCFPPALTEPDEPDGRPREPVAADARRQGDGPSNAVLRIAAGMLGVGFDALRRRDTRRRHRRLVAIAAGSLAMAAITIVLAVTAVIARNEAQERRAEAEDLIDFMLGDLREQLRKIGRLDVFESVGDEALAYFSRQDDGEDSLRNLAQRARNLRQIGEVRLEQGDQRGALEAFEASRSISERMAAQAQQDPEIQVALANSRFYVGWVHWQRGEMPQAQAMFESIIPIVDGVSARDPGNPKWLVERAYANTNLGRVLESQGAHEAALEAYEAVMNVNRELVDLEPGNSEWQMELGFAHNNLGKLLFALGRLDEAESHFRRDLELKAVLYQADTSHNVLRSYLAASQYFLGQLLSARGEYQEARVLLEESIRHFSVLSEVDSERAGWSRRLANAERELGKLEGLAGKAQGGAALLDSSIEALRMLVESNPEDAGARGDLARSLLYAADFSGRAGDAAAATTRIASAQAHLGALLEQQPSVLENQELAAYAELCQARIADSARAAGLLQAVVERLDREFPGSANPVILELRAEALAGLGQTGRATELREHLSAIGYRGWLIWTSELMSG